MTINSVGVLGCGLMGSGIAQVSATAGFDVTVLEAEQKFLDKGFAATTNFTYLAGAAVITVIPVVALYVVLQRSFARGMLSGALKG